MSSAMVTARGGSKNLISTQRKGSLVLSGIVQDTMANSPRAIPMRSLENLVANTTGIVRDSPLMEGVIASTVPASRRDAPELMPSKSEDKTASKMGSGIPYSGDKSGYGAASSSKSKSKSSAPKSSASKYK